MMEGVDHKGYKVDRESYNVVRGYDAQRAALNDFTKQGLARGLERQMPRLSRWNAGDVYAPHDLSAVEAAKWKKRKGSQRDVFDMLGINPLHEYKVRCLFIFNFIFSNGEMWSMGYCIRRDEKEK